MNGSPIASRVEFGLSASWVKTGPAAGLLGIAAYFAAATGLLPQRAALLAAFSMGPLLSVAFIGFYHFLRAHRNSAALQTAAVFGVIAGTLVNLMLVVQQALFVGISRETRAAMGPAWEGLNWVQLGIDVSWDIYISLAIILLGPALIRHPRFGPLLGGITIAAGLTLLVLNLWTFPAPPGDSGLFDAGPFVGLWFAALSVRALFSVGWWTRRYATPEAGEAVI
jgi:hypothetical protein